MAHIGSVFGGLDFYADTELNSAFPNRGRGFCSLLERLGF